MEDHKPASAAAADPAAVSAAPIASAVPAASASAPAPAAAPAKAPDHPDDAPRGPRNFPVTETDRLRQAFETGRYPYARAMGRLSYEAEKLKVQAELLKVQIWAQETGQSS